MGRLVTANLSNHDIATVSLIRRAETAQRLRELFPEVPVVVTESPDWLDAVRDLIGGRTVGAALGPIGGSLSAPARSAVSGRHAGGVWTHGR